jgi:hypothetical protein
VGKGAGLGGGGLFAPAAAAASLHQGLKPVAFSNQPILFHMMSSQLFPTMPPVSPLFWFQHQKSMLGTLSWSTSSACMYRAKSSSIARSDCAEKNEPVSPKITGNLLQFCLSVSLAEQKPRLVR